MASETYGELELFGICLVVGIVIGFLYDGFRILRLLFVHRDILVDLEDLCFGGKNPKEKCHFYHDNIPSGLCNDFLGSTVGQYISGIA